MLERRHNQLVYQSDTKTPPSIAELSSVIRRSGEIGPREERETWILDHFTPEELAGLKESILRHRAQRNTNDLTNELSARVWSQGHGPQPIDSLEDAGLSIPYFHGGKNGLGQYIASVDYEGTMSAGPGQTRKPLKVPGIINRKVK